MWDTKKQKRNKNYEDFKETHLPYISLHCDCYKEGNSNSFKMDIEGDILIYFPKSNKCHYPKNNNWVGNGLNHIYKKLKIQKPI